ncbi:unnamed protein product [Rhizophagus irregularis]|nr:unnamed protein product [Rhizophagus irregularis]
MINYYYYLAYKETFAYLKVQDKIIINRYDALPGIGHSCGHNLIAIGGAIALKAIFEKHEIPGKVKLFGRKWRWKIELIKIGAYDDDDDVGVSLMIHPSPLDGSFLNCNKPWERINALNAMAWLIIIMDY